MNEYIRQLINEEKARQEEAKRAEAEQLAREEAEEQAKNRAEWEKVREAIRTAIPEATWPYLVALEPDAFPAHQACLELRVEGLAPVEAWVQRGKNGYEFLTFYVMRAHTEHNYNQPPSVKWVAITVQRYNSLAAVLVAAEREHEHYQELKAELAARQAAQQAAKVAKAATVVEAPHHPAQTLIKEIRRFVQRYRGSYE